MTRMRSHHRTMLVIFSSALLVGIVPYLHAAPAGVGDSAAPLVPPSGGQAIYQLWCTGCHAAQGTPGRPMPAGTAILQARYQGRLPAVLTERTDLTVPYIEQMVRHGRNVMPFFRKTEISDQQLAALAAWLAHTKQ